MSCAMAPPQPSTSSTALLDMVSCSSKSNHTERSSLRRSTGSVSRMSKRLVSSPSRQEITTLTNETSSPDVAVENVGSSPSQITTSTLTTAKEVEKDDVSHTSDNVSPRCPPRIKKKKPIEFDTIDWGASDNSEIINSLSPELLVDSISKRRSPSPSPLPMSPKSKSKSLPKHRNSSTKSTPSQESSSTKSLDNVPKIRKRKVAKAPTTGDLLDFLDNHKASRSKSPSPKPARRTSQALPDHGASTSWEVPAPTPADAELKRPRARLQSTSFSCPTISSRSLLFVSETGTVPAATPPSSPSSSTPPSHHDSSKLKIYTEEAIQAMDHQKYMKARALVLETPCLLEDVDWSNVPRRSSWFKDDEVEVDARSDITVKAFSSPSRSNYGYSHRWSVFSGSTLVEEQEISPIREVCKLPLIEGMPRLSRKKVMELPSSNDLMSSSRLHEGLISALKSRSLQHAERAVAWTERW